MSAGAGSRNVAVSGAPCTVRLTANQMPSHAHSGQLVSSTSEGDRNDPDGAYQARPEDPLQPYGGGRVRKVNEPVYAGANGALKIAYDMPVEAWEQLR